MGSQDAFDAAVADEIAKGHLDRILWTKAFANSGGTESATKSLYVRYRVQQLAALERARRVRAGLLIVWRVSKDIMFSVIPALLVGLAAKHFGRLGLAESDRIPKMESLTFIIVSIVTFPFFLLYRRGHRNRRQV